MVAGFSLAAWGIQQGVRVTDEWGFWQFFNLQVARGLGTMIAMISAQQMSVASLPVTMMKDASGLVNLVRNVAGAIGLAMLSTILSHQGAVHYLDIASAASMSNATSAGLVDGLTQMMGANGAADPDGMAAKAMSMMMHRQAAVLSFGDAFAVLALGCWLSVGVALFVKPAKNAPPPPQGAGGH
jgi:DHA2 family multidrug resistance protein